VVTGSGCSYGDTPDANGTVRDARRIDFYRSHLAALARSIEDGGDVRSYHV